MSAKLFPRTAIPDYRNKTRRNRKKREKSIKKYLFWGTVFWVSILTGTLGVLFAETAGPMQAGVAAVVKGEVKATTPPEKAAHPLKSGDKIFMGDKIETGKDGQLQILLLDQTVFTLGPLSDLVVDELIYDPDNAGAKAKAGMVKGVFRAVTGKVAHKERDNAAEAEDLLNVVDDMDQKSLEAAQDRTQR